MRRAFTLVEMLVAVVLLSLLIGVAVFSFRLQLIAVHKARTEGLRSAITASEIHEILESIKHYAVQRYDTLNQPIPRSWHELFRGEADRMRFVTTHPLFLRGDVLAQLSCEGTTLRYTEAPLYGSMDFLRPDFPKKIRSYTLLRDLKACRFRYVDRLGGIHDAFVDLIPRAVWISVERENAPREYFVTVKSDNNLTADVISGLHEQ